MNTAELPAACADKIRRYVVLDEQQITAKEIFADCKSVTDR
jgi:hypothetical protein